MNVSNLIIFVNFVGLTTFWYWYRYSS